MATTEKPSTKGSEASDIQMTAPAEADATRSLTLTISGGAFKSLEGLAKAKGGTISDVVREAIALEKWFVDTRTNGSRILVEKDGKMQEVIRD